LHWNGHGLGLGLECSDLVNITVVRSFKYVASQNFLEGRAREYGGGGKEQILGVAYVTK